MDLTFWGSRELTPVRYGFPPNKWLPVILTRIFHLQVTNLTKRKECGLVFLKKTIICTICSRQRIPNSPWWCIKSYWGSSAGDQWRSCNCMSKAHYLYELICSEEGLAPTFWIGVCAGVLAYHLRSGAAPPMWTWWPLPGSSHWTAARMSPAAGPSAKPALAPCW